MRLVCDAISFCYGPATVLKKILEVWRSYFSDITLLAAGTSREYFRRYSGSDGLVDRIVSMDTEDLEELRHVGECWDVLLCVCNPISYPILKNRVRRTVYWDFLLWMRYETGGDEFSADYYMIEGFPGTTAALRKWAPRIQNPVTSPILVDWEARPAEMPLSEQTVINLGGQRSRLTTPGVNTHYPYWMIELFQEAASRTEHRGPFLVTSDARTAEELNERFACPGWFYRSLSHDDFLSAVAASRLVVTHPGLYSPFEALGLGKPVFFLPSSNYTQILQLNLFRQRNLAPRSVDWNNLVGKDVPWGLPEEIGVQRVLELIKECRETDVSRQLIAEFSSWLTIGHSDLRELSSQQRNSAQRYFGDYHQLLDRIAKGLTHEQ